MLNCNGLLLSLESPKVMAIVNLTPDSFYDGGKLDNEKKIAQQIDLVIEQGADIIDFGAMSSRPGAKIISEDEEISRLDFPLHYTLKNYPKVPISIDTLHSKTAEHCLNQGAHIINDISGGHYDENMLSTVSNYPTPYIAMHMRGTPHEMTTLNNYPNGLFIELLSYFKTLINRTESFGIKDVIIDPGFGFAKNVNQNYTLLHDLNVLKVLSKPMLVGLSRKSFIYKRLKTTPFEALNGTTALHMAALERGANILRAHDVKECKEVIILHDLLHSSNEFR